MELSQIREFTLFFSRAIIEIISIGGNIKSKIIKVNAKQRDASRKSVKALMYNEISEGEYKGWFKLEELIPPEGAKMSIWTKEQSTDLDKRFSEVNNRIDNVEINLNKRIDNVEINLNIRIDGVESKVDEILSILKNK